MCHSTAHSPLRRVKLKLCAIPSQNLPIRHFERPTPLKMKRIQRAERATRRDLMFKKYYFFIIFFCKISIIM